jgi:hypothetical protein
MSKNSTSILSLTVIADGAVTANRFVTPLAAQAVAEDNSLGVSRFTAADGEPLTVDVLGTATVEAGGAITAGDKIEADASGRAVTWSTSGPVLGRALEDASGAGKFLEVLLIPN